MTTEREFKKLKKKIDLLEASPPAKKMLRARAPGLKPFVTKVTIGPEIAKMFERAFKDSFGRKPTQQEFVKFVKEDIDTYYSEAFEDGLWDALGAAFADDFDDDEY